MTTLEKAGVLEQCVAALSTYNFTALAEHYRDDVLFDANVPLWRFQLQGPDAILEMAEEEFGEIADLSVRAVRASYADDVATVEVAVGHGSGDEARHWREVHLLHLDGGRIVEHTVYCTGVWDAATTAKQAAEAPMVRP